MNKKTYWPIGIIGIIIVGIIFIVLIIYASTKQPIETNSNYGLSKDYVDHNINKMLKMQYAFEKSYHVYGGSLDGSEVGYDRLKTPYFSVDQRSFEHIGRKFDEKLHHSILTSSDDVIYLKLEPQTKTPAVKIESIYLKLSRIDTNIDLDYDMLQDKTNPNIYTIAVKDLTKLGRYDGVFTIKYKLDGKEHYITYQKTFYHNEEF
ncbi:hypothetical protein BKH43_04205 [Helicobacter sp. 13S00401-1]|uniref:hypothetical protein n=1 Tax=Helicobacter sp. 13S00401-1 TaxID=1905758 RepID=UPI000BA640B3|nr:hypothetical protein [Helicobacter sp. 13S00401-1]PAF50766.1 hypothetical protein BKH43_04205 [Helicobacter sp. 13S00401-1]